MTLSQLYDTCCYHQILNDCLISKHKGISHCHLICCQINMGFDCFVNHHILLTFYKASQLLVVLIRPKYVSLLPHLLKLDVTCEQFHERTIIFPIKLQCTSKQKKTCGYSWTRLLERDIIASSIWWFEQHKQAVSTNSIILQRR